MNSFLLWVVALPLLTIFLAAGCSEGPPRTPQQTREEAHQAAEAAQNKALTADAERRQKAESDRAPNAADSSPEAPAHLHPDTSDEDEEMDK